MLKKKKKLTRSQYISVKTVQQLLLAFKFRCMLRISQAKLLDETKRLHKKMFLQGQFSGN